jgi:hypothetical protein
MLRGEVTGWFSCSNRGAALVPDIGPSPSRSVSG